MVFDKKQLYQIFPLASLVITTKNEKDHILNCIKSVRAQTYPNIELLVIDNYSTDGTREIAKEYADRLFMKGPERSIQRNYGIGKAKGEYIIYLDADMQLQPNLIEEAVKQIQKTKAVALHIPEKILGESFFSRVRNFERSFYDGTVIDGVRFFTKEAFIKAGCFWTEVTGQEDWSLDLQIKKDGGKISLLKNSWINHNESEFNLKKYLDKKSYYSNTFNIYQEKWEGNEDVKKQLSPHYRFVGVFTENQKYKKILKHPLLFCGVIYLRLRVGWRYLIRNGS